MVKPVLLETVIVMVSSGSVMIARLQGLHQDCYLVDSFLLCRYCNETLPTGYENITCNHPDLIVYVDLDRHFWQCAEVRNVIYFDYKTKISRTMGDVRVLSMLDARRTQQTNLLKT